MSDDLIAHLRDLLENRGNGQYGLHDITQREHALQAALLASNAGDPPALVIAALLHDVGHLVHNLGENPAGEGIDDRHEQIGYDYLAQWFGPEVTEPVRLHVAAKRYLCSTEPDYVSKLSKDSVLSLSLQGGLMSKSAMDAFRAQRYHKEAIQLRRYDEMAKVKDLATPPTDYFLGFVSACLKRER